MSAAASSTSPPTWPTVLGSDRDRERDGRLSIGELIAEQVRVDGRDAVLQDFQHDGAWGPNMAAVYSDRGHGVRAPVVFYNRSNEAAARLKPGDFDWASILAAACAGFTAAAFSRRCPKRRPSDHRGMEAAKARRGRFVRSELPREALESIRGRVKSGGCPGTHRRKTSMCWWATRRIYRRARHRVRTSRLKPSSIRARFSHIDRS